MKYIKEAHKDTGCFFCAYLRQKRDSETFILHRGEHCFSILNRYPYNTGHLMVAPRVHKASLADLNAEEILDLWGQARQMQAILDRALHPQGYNLGINLGRIAGAGVLGHLHLHIVPRWNGDTNFMPVVGGTKVMPLALGDLYRQLRRALRAMSSA